MKRKIKKYLNSKEVSQYTILDNIFIEYLYGNLNDLLIKKGFINIEVYPQIGALGRCLQFDCGYYNLIITIEFDETEYDYGVYLPGCSVEEFTNCIKKFQYKDDFTISGFIKELCITLNNDERLKK